MRLVRLLVILLVFAVCSFAAETPAQDSAALYPSDIAFSHVSISIQGGEIYPWGDLLDVVENSAYIGLGLRYSYWADFDGILHFDYAYFKTRNKEIPYPGVHQAMGRLG